MAPPPTRVLTIGSSCINRFQFDFFQTRHPDTAPRFVRSLFDWNITSLTGTETVLRLAAEGRLRGVLQDKSQYYVAWDVLLFHRQIPGLCLFHEQESAKVFDDPSQQDTLISKLIHQAAPFLSADDSGSTHLIWSNIQPNLPDTVDNVTPWEQFRLTAPRYTAITTLGSQLFGRDTTFSFLGIEEDVADELVGKPDVHIVNLPRGIDYEGPPDLYEPLLLGLLGPTKT
ncbi:hypothetical protein [uncultured Marivita sp.]|uniref:hypothetical protein n=1 Tax=uncultured Marivita sp. TaxID=888080 RepID=UPI00261D0102|nr:hypothetical protein [uncultured Marivita sp.]